MVKSIKNFFSKLLGSKKRTRKVVQKGGADFNSIASDGAEFLGKSQNQADKKRDFHESKIYKVKNKYTVTPTNKRENKYVPIKLPTYTNTNKKTGKKLSTYFKQPDNVSKAQFNANSYMRNLWARQAAISAAKLKRVNHKGRTHTNNNNNNNNISPPALMWEGFNKNKALKKLLPTNSNYSYNRKTPAELKKYYENKKKPVPVWAQTRKRSSGSRSRSRSRSHSGED